MMTRLEYINALRRALAEQQPPVSLDIAANVVAHYNQRFADGLAAGGSEADIAAALGEPHQIAATLSSSTTSSSSTSPSTSTSGAGATSFAAQGKALGHMKAAQLRHGPGHVLRMLITAAGLGIFNLFMVVPAVVYAALLATLYALSLGFYIAGIAITASGLAGANELMLYGPLSYVAADLQRDWDRAHHQPTETRVTIGADGILVHQEASRDGKTNLTIGNDAYTSKGEKPAADGQGVLLHAEQLAGSNVRIRTSDSAESRTTQSVFGIAMVLGAIVLFLIGLVVTRYTLIGIRRYAQMNWSLLQGH